MKKEWLLLGSSVAVSLFLGLALMRWLAPELFNLPKDLRLVQVDDKVPPFFDGVFRREDLKSSEFLLNDPYTGTRAKPLYPQINQRGPHDILGFRNRAVPNVADIVVIGDSQTYGNNAVLENNWPSQMGQQLSEKSPVVYNMAVGGWGAVQYLEMFTHALAFQPRVVVVAFYTGNDALESFRMAYGVEKWNALRVNPQLSAADIPQIEYPPPESELEEMNFPDGTRTVFAPVLRLGANQDHPVIDAGYEIMANVAQYMSEISANTGVELVFTIIPTKEYVFARKIARDGLRSSQSYQTLLERETANIRRLAEKLADLPNAAYVDVAAPLQEAALSSQPIYLENDDGHPTAAGYAIIAETVASHTGRVLKKGVEGLVALQFAPERYQLLLVNDEGVWNFANEEISRANGWQGHKAKIVEHRDIAGLPMRGTITVADRSRFGPKEKRQ